MCGNVWYCGICGEYGSLLFVIDYGRVGNFERVWYIGSFGRVSWSILGMAWYWGIFEQVWSVCERLWYWCNGVLHVGFVAPASSVDAMVCV